jgi:hypothetical protein
MNIVYLRTGDLVYIVMSDPLLKKHRKIMFLSFKKIEKNQMQQTIYLTNV